jgi:hypothetical protein
MSLEVAAKHLAAHGRHGDSTLVHMSPKEVAGLQALARSKGKSLSTNPHTGLPEAFDLGQELGNATSGIAAPALGAALVYFSGGVIDPVTAGVIVGGTHYAATGDVKSSVMGGVGAFGGGSMAGNVMGAGTGAVESGSGTAGMSESEAVNASTNAIQNATPYDTLAAGAQSVWSNPSTVQALGGYKVLGAAALPIVSNLTKRKAVPTSPSNPQMIRPYTYDYNQQYANADQQPMPMVGTKYQPGQDTSERLFFKPKYTPLEPYKAADGGIIALAMGGMAAGGGPVELMSNQATTGANTMYPMANMTTSAFATPYQDPRATNMMSAMAPSGGGTVDQMSGEPNMQGTRLAAGGISNLGGYSDGGRLLRGPGDGVSDSIPAQIGQHQPARLADGEFVVPARIVSELGNGSTEAGAKQLYKMLDRVQNARAKTTGKEKVAKNTNAAKYLPA